METTFGEDADEVRAQLAKHGFSTRLAEQVTRHIEPTKSCSVFDVVDSLTRYAGRECQNAGDRLVVDQKAAALLSLAA